MISTENTATALRTQASFSDFDIRQAISSHLELARKSASVAYRRYGKAFDRDDLEGYANLGLVWAAQKYAVLSYDIRQGIDFTAYAEKRIWRNMEMGRDGMATIHRFHYQKIKKGQMAQPKFVRDTEDFQITDALASPESDHLGKARDSRLLDMISWLRSFNAASAQVIELMSAGSTAAQISALTGKSDVEVNALYREGMALLRLQYNPGHEADAKAELVPGRISDRFSGRNTYPTDSEMLGWLRLTNRSWAEVIELKQGGLSYTKIAAATGKSPAAVQSLFRRGIDMLRAKFDPSEEATAKAELVAAKRRARRLGQNH